MHKITTVAVNHYQVRNTVLRDSEAMEVCIRRPRAPEICRTQVIDLGLIKAGKEGCSFLHMIKNGGRTAAHFELKGCRRKSTYQRKKKAQGIRRATFSKKKKKKKKGIKEERAH